MQHLAAGSRKCDREIGPQPHASRGGSIDNQQLPRLVFVVVGTAAVCALGIALASLTTTADSATTIPPFITILLAVIPGAFVLVDQLPDSLVQIGKAAGAPRRGASGRSRQGPITSRGETARSWASGFGGLIFCADVLLGAARQRDLVAASVSQFLASAPRARLTDAGGPGTIRLGG